MNTNGHEFFRFYSCEFVSIRGSLPFLNEVDAQVRRFLSTHGLANLKSTTKWGMRPELTGAFPGLRGRVQNIGETGGFVN